MPDNPEKEIAQRRSQILKALSAAAGDRPMALVAVSKRQSPERIDAALSAGHRLFGENRVQEAIEHWSDRRGQYRGVELHLIGPLQTNKAEEAVALFDMIETLDRPKLARALRKAMDKLGREVPCLIQVNTGEEEQKAGVSPDGLDDLLVLARSECGIRVDGLMCIPPVGEPAGPHFALLKKLASERGLPVVSMGMSGDYELAARLGATHVRVGSALFGTRQA